ncbi:MAG: hypothetical protein NT118_12760, partial [Lentisphaerae bacterium]|nr:hypothetical protein [Lentisphaerota bacterium]
MSGKIAFNGRDGLDMDRRKYMSKHDIVYESPSYYGFDGMPLGNGNMGAMVTTSQNSLNFVINRNDAWDDSPTGICYGETDFEQNSILRHCGECVIETGYPVLDLMYLKNFEERLSLHDAELDLKAETPFSKISSEM